MGQDEILDVGAQQGRIPHFLCKPRTYVLRPRQQRRNWHNEPNICSDHDFHSRRIR